tara:strand:+ start:33916 stop:34233 length:318 start_codon:yes stop_codon:yes gene_type:complete
MIMLLLGWFTQAVYAEIYKWEDKSENPHFSDEKPDKDRPEQVKVQVNSIEAVSVSASGFLKAGEHHQVVMYSAAWCSYCRKARNYFWQQGIPFKEYDIEASRKGR